MDDQLLLVSNTDSHHQQQQQHSMPLKVVVDDNDLGESTASLRGINLKLTVCSGPESDSGSSIQVTLVWTKIRLGRLMFVLGVYCVVIAQI